MIRPYLERHQILNVQIDERYDDIDTTYAETAILLVPSLWEEPFGRVIVEAMSFGIPVIANDVGGIKEAMNGGGFLIDVNETYKNRVDYYFNVRYHLSVIDRYIKTICLLDNLEVYEKESQISLATAAATEKKGSDYYDEFSAWLKRAAAGSKSAAKRGSTQKQN